MANITVYPYGTGGSLPSSIGIINDLITGGVDKALSAQQGVVLNEKTETPQAIDLSTIGVLIGVLTSNGKWSGTTNGQSHMQIPVKSGQVYRIVGNASTASYYAYFSSLSFWASYDTPNYPSGNTGRKTISAGATVDVSIPEGCKYLYLAVTNQGTVQTPQSVTFIGTINDVPDAISSSVSALVGNKTEKCNYENDEFQFTGTSEQGEITKVGNSGYLLNNIAKTAYKYFLYTLPDGLVDGKTYLLSFNYKSWLSSAWYMGVVGADTANQAAPQRGVSIPSSGSGRVSYRYTFLNGDKYLRLASNSQNDNKLVCIENLSIVEYDDTIVSLAKRVELLDGGQNVGVASTYKYFGRKIDLSEPSYGYSVYMSSIAAHQSAACYGDYMVTFTDQMSSIRLYNLRTKTLLATVTRSSLDEFHHCNQSFFGTQFYEEGDAFPLVYISVNNNGKTAGGYMEAYRIVPSVAEGATEYSSFTITLVQTVTLPIMSEENALGNANFVLDADSGYLFTYSRNNVSTDANYNICRITKWNMPKLSQGDVTFTDDDRLDSWEVDTSAFNMQGGAIKNHMLFIFRGYQSAGYIQLHVFDLVRKDRVAFIDLRSTGFTMEPEGVFFWGNTLCMTKSDLYRFFFK